MIICYVLFKIILGLFFKFVLVGLFKLGVNKDIVVVVAIVLLYKIFLKRECIEVMFIDFYW